MPQIIDVPGMGQVEFPDGMKDAEIVAAIKRSSQTETSKADRFTQGLRDPVDAGAQLLTKSLPGGIVSGVNKATQFVNDLPGIGPITKAMGMTPSTPQQIDQGIAQREANYVAPKGMDWMRLGGNLASTAPLAAAIPAAGSMGGAIASGVGTGAGFGALQPVAHSQENFWTEKGKQAGIGAAGGGLLAPVGRGAARMISPQTREPVRRLMAEGTTPTPGQILGGMFQRAEDKLRSVPILGDAITSSQRRGVEELNRAAYGRAVNPIGGTVPKEVGREGVADVSRQLSTAYDKLLPKLQFKADPQFGQELARVQQMASQLPPQQAQQFERIVRDQVVGKLTPQGNASGETIKAMESELGRLARGYRGDPSFDVRQLGSAIQEMQSSIRTTLERANPAHARELSAINEGYAAYARIRDAASRQGSADGVFTPAQLSAAVRSGDKSAGKGNYARGTAQMQDLSDAAKSVLSQTIPNSGTTDRLLMGGGALGAGMVNPMIPGVLGAASLPYLPGGRQLAAGLLTRRPAGAEAVAEGVRRLPVGLLAPSLYPALNN